MGHPTAVAARQSRLELPSWLATTRVWVPSALRAGGNARPHTCRRPAQIITLFRSGREGRFESLRASKSHVARSPAPHSPHGQRSGTRKTTCPRGAPAATAKQAPGIRSPHRRGSAAPPTALPARVTGAAPPTLCFNAGVGHWRAPPQCFTLSSPARVNRRYRAACGCNVLIRPRRRWHRSHHITGEQQPALDAAHLARAAAAPHRAPQ